MFGIVIPAIKSGKILKKCYNSCDPGYIGVVRPSSAKLKIFAKYFLTHECEEIAKSAKNLEKCTKIM